MSSPTTSGRRLSICERSGRAQLDQRPSQPLLRGEPQRARSRRRSALRASFVSTRPPRATREPVLPEHLSDLVEAIPVVHERGEHARAGSFVRGCSVRSPPGARAVHHHDYSGGRALCDQRVVELLDQIRRRGSGTHRCRCSHEATGREDFPLLTYSRMSSSGATHSCTAVISRLMRNASPAFEKYGRSASLPSIRRGGSEKASSYTRSSVHASSIWSTSTVAAPAK